MIAHSAMKQQTRAMRSARVSSLLHQSKMEGDTSSSLSSSSPPSPSPSRTTSLASSCFGPVSLVGGTAAIYTSLLQHPSSTLTQLSFVFMMLLAIQYAVQPRLSKKYISPKINKQSVALVEEVVKTGMAAAIFFAKPRIEVQNALKGTR